MIIDVIKMIWAKCTGGVLVYLIDYDGEVTSRIARKSRSGKLTTLRFRMAPNTRCYLKDDGTVAGADYVDKWKYATPRIFESFRSFYD